MKNKNLISVSGYINCGKDTVATIINYLTSGYEGSFESYQNDIMPPLTYEIGKFAWKLKKIASILTGVPVYDFEKQDVKSRLMPPEWQNEDGDRTYRWFLQMLGTESVRDVLHINAWVNALFADFKEDSKWIITDTRFPNELQAVRDRNGICIRVYRDGANSNTMPHSSEISLDNVTDWDYVIENNAGINELIEKVKEILIKEGII